MAAPLSMDLRKRLVRAVEQGSSARKAARRLGVSPSAAIKLVSRVRRTGSSAPARSAAIVVRCWMAKALLRELTTASRDYAQRDPGDPDAAWHRSRFADYDLVDVAPPWARTKKAPEGSRAGPARCGRAPQDQRTASTAIFGAICPQTGAAAGLVMPWCNTEAMGLHLAEIATRVTLGWHCALLVDQAGWHICERLVVPANITIVPLPANAQS